MKNSFSAVILSSGLSTRMGSPKGLLRWDRSKNFIQKIIDEYRLAGCRDMVCTINHDIEEWCAKQLSPQKVKIVVNLHPERGMATSMRIGLQQLTPDSYCFIHPVDNPAVSADIIRLMMSNCNPSGWCSPLFEGQQGHPVLISTEIVRHILSLPDEDIPLNETLGLFAKTEIETGDSSVLVNINSPEDYFRYFNHPPY